MREFTINMTNSIAIMYLDRFINNKGIKGATFRLPSKVHVRRSFSLVNFLRCFSIVSFSNTMFLDNKI